MNRGLLNWNLPELSIRGAGQEDRSSGNENGAYDEGPLCYLLQVDEFRFLLDCGWNETFSADLIEPVKK